MSAKDFVKQYESALGTQNWDNVAPLIRDDAVVIFSNGALHSDKEAIKFAYQSNFNSIKSAIYRIENLHWLVEAAEFAA